MAIATILGLGVAILLMQPMPVDFKLRGVASSNGVPIRLSPPPAPPEDQPDQAVPLPVARPRPILATGFGRDVPLDFAVRQIVPASVHVQYGDSVDRTLRVSWHGGQPWRQVLRATLVPLKLHAVASGSTVRIAE